MSLKGQTELDTFVESLRVDKRSKHTVCFYRMFVRQMLRYINKEPRDITLDDLNKYKAYMAGKYCAGSMVTHIATIKTFFRTLDLNTAEKLRSPKKPKHLVNVLTKDEVKGFLEKSKETDPMDYAMFSVLYYGGLRAEEVAKLRLEDINFEEKTIRVNSGKGDKDGIIRIHTDALNAINDYLPHRKTPKDGSETLFIGKKCRHITKNLLEKRTKEYAVKMGIKKRVYPHLFRHSLATHMIMNGADIIRVQEQLRHERIETTIKYVHLVKKELKKAYDTFVPSLTQPKPDEVQPKIIVEQLKPVETEAQSKHRESDTSNLIEVLERRYIMGEIPTEIYKELKSKYSHAESQNNEIIEKQEDTSEKDTLNYIG